MLKLVELYYLIKELNYYDDNIVRIIKYFYEFELEFINKFKSFILTFNQLNTNFYSYIHTFYKYKYCKIFLHNLNYKRDTVCFHINIYFNDGSQKKSLILENYLNLQQIIKHMNNYYKQCRTVDSTKKVINDLKLFNFNKIINILLQQKNIYKQ